MGEFLVSCTMLNKMDPFELGGLRLNAGFVALAVNMAVFLLASLAAKAPRSMSVYRSTLASEPVAR